MDECSDNEELKTPSTSNENSQDSKTSTTKSENKCKNLEVEDIEDLEMEKLKGDAIGDTLYSERFVLKTLMELKEMDTEQKLDSSMVNKDTANFFQQSIQSI